jgi:large subunit ribosomal protein L23
MQLFEVLRRPLITEKYSGQQAQGKYTFEVSMTATKTQIKEAVEKAWKVNVVSVNVLRVVGKNRRRGRMVIPARPWKKAIVTLKPGDKIEIFEGSQV